MPLRSLVFSSDRETAQLLDDAVRELGMEVEHCPEIFGAVERLTLETFDVLMVDWNDEPEASFLLRAAREMKSNQPPFPVAVVEEQNSVDEAIRAGANHVLIKSQACSDLLQFQGQTRNVERAPEGRANDPVCLPLPEAAVERDDDGTVIASSSGYAQPDFVPSFAGYASPDATWRTKAIRTKARPRASAPVYKSAAAFLGLVAAMFISVWRLGPLVSPEFPVLHASGLFEKASATQRQLAERITHWLKRSSEDDDESGSAAPEQIVVAAQQTRRPVPAAKPSPLQSPPELVSALNVQPSPPPYSAAAETAPIPESLRRSPESLSVRSVVANLGPTLLGALEPVLVPEEISRKLLMQRIQPNYPREALQAGLQGPVVLQAWIGRDGKIRDLKLVRGYLVLGKAAFDAVKQWRYQPYYRNGQAMETQTYITVNFTPNMQVDRTQ